MAKKSTRVETDSMGPMEIPKDAYYGASTMRAVKNFPVSNLRFSRQFIRALGLIKLSCAEINVELGLLSKSIGNPILEASKDVADGTLDKEFVVDIFQTGSGTSTNMNANEIISNRAAELAGGKVGKKTIHPNDHVNMGQSSNDVIPTATNIAAILSINEDLIPALTDLKTTLLKKACEFWEIIKTGRTHLQDATPIRLGQEFMGYAGQIERSIKRTQHAIDELSEVALGGTAVGTGVNTHHEFPQKVCSKISTLIGITIKETDNHFQAQNTLDSIVEASGSIRSVAISLYKIANDIRWMGSGPRAGIGELSIPEVQPGSSIMPGKVNPVIPESMIQVCAQVIGNDAVIVQASQGSYFELNTMMPVATHNILQTISLLSNGISNFNKQCVQGLKATTKGPSMVERGLAICTALAPIIGYDAAAKIAKHAADTGKTIKEVALEKTSLSVTELDSILDPVSMTTPEKHSNPKSA